MNEPPFDFDAVFGDDYMHFYQGLLTRELSDHQVAVIRKLTGAGPGTRVLDCPCGFGRIAGRLVAAGASVVGIDVTPAFLEIARREAAGVDYRLGDMRELDLEAQFDLVVNVFTSFGYFGDDADLDVLRRFHRALKPGGKLAIDLMSFQRILSGMAAQGGRSTVLLERGDDLLVDRNTYEAASGRILTERISVRDGRVRRYPFSTRLLSPSEIGSWLREAGFSAVSYFDQDGEPYTLAARRMWVVASA